MSRRRLDACAAEDVPNAARRQVEAEPDQLPVDALVAQLGFSAASRNTSSRADVGSGGRPACRASYVQRRRTSSRSQRNSVAGRTRNERGRSRGITLLNAASSTRSDERRRGRATCRRSTCSSWRRTRISTSFARSSRPINNSSSNRRRTAQYTNANTVESSTAVRTRRLYGHRIASAQVTPQAPASEPSSPASEFLGPTRRDDRGHRRPHLPARPRFTGRVRPDPARRGAAAARPSRHPRHGVWPSVADDRGYALIRAFASRSERDAKLGAFYGSKEWLERFDDRVGALIESYHVVVIDAPARTLLPG
jgi:hypothetical protein